MRLSVKDNVKNFFSGKESPYYTAAFRIGIAAFCLTYVFATRNSVLDIYGEYGFTGWELSKTYLKKHLPHISDVTLLFARAEIGTDQAVLILHSIFTLALVSLLFGFGTRIAAILAWCLSYLFLYAGIGTINGMNMFLHIAIFYLMVLPSNKALAFDVLLFKTSKSNEVKSFTRKILQIHVALIYVSSGIEKAIGEQWWNGDALWRALNMPIHRVYDMTWIAGYPTAVTAIGIAIVMMEISYGCCIWIKKVRVLWLALTIMMHLFIAVFLGLWYFSAIMIMLNLGAFGPEIYSDLSVRKRKAGLRQLATINEIAAVTTKERAGETVHE